MKVQFGFLLIGRCYTLNSRYRQTAVQVHVVAPVGREAGAYE